MWKDWGPWMRERLNRHAPHARRILEIGGEGRELGDFLQGREFVSLSSPAGDICRPTRWPSNSFDVVVAKMSLEHFYDPFAAADEITRLLAPGGLLLMMTVWSWRFHTAPGVDDYFRFSTSGLRQLFPRLEELECGYDLTDRRTDCRQDEVPVDQLGGWREHWYVFLVARKPGLAEAPPARHRPNVSLLGYPLEHVKAAVDQLLASPEAADAVQRVMQVKPEHLEPGLLGEGERGLPSEPRFVESGYSRMMLGRYLFAGAMACRDQDVLDAGAGLGWGAYLVAQYPRSVTAVEVDPACGIFARSTWPAENVTWVSGDIFDGAGLGQFYDVALAMETVEHFTPSRASDYIARLAASLRAGGMLFGTSAFPATEPEAAAIAARNPHHPHIFTEQEFLGLLQQHFARAAIIGNWMFLAIR